MQLQVMNSPFDQKQTELLNELLHNLSATQRIWLSGYLSAAPVANVVETGPSTVPTQPQEAQEITVLYGTQTGNAQQLAETFTEQLKAKGLHVTAVDMNDFRPNNLKKLTNLLVIVSTHGEGDPPDTALQFHEFLFSRRAPKLEKLNYAVLALGDSSYEHFCLTGKEIDERLKELGAKQLAPRIDCDVDFDDAAEAWYGSVENALEEAGSVQQVSSTTISSGEKVTSLYSRTNPFTAEVLENINLNGRGSNKETRHVELLIEESNLKFEPGDSIGIYAQNDEELVDALINAFDWDAAGEVSIKDERVTVREALIHHYEITVLTKPLLQKIADTFEKKQIYELLSEENEAMYKDYIENYDLLDAVKDFSLKGVAVDALIPLLRKLPPRLYSVASSYEANPDEVHLTIGTVRYNAGGRERKGVCSVHCAEKIEPGDTLNIYVHRNPNFRLPEDPNVPIIMIGPGTGVAPFRSFLEEREENSAEGKSWLFFGDQHYVTDFLYQVDWQRWLNSGVLTRMDVAFSRDSDEKVYVQHRMLEKKTELYTWLEAGAVVYVCGDEKHMAKDVHDTLIQIVQEEGNVSKEEALTYVKELQQQKRYQRDIY